jgi:hypothetical protein
VAASAVFRVTEHRICVPRKHTAVKKKQEEQCRYKRNIKTRSRNHCCLGKAISLTYSECVSVALDTQHAKRMRHIILSPVASLALQYFSTVSHKRHDFRKKSFLK